MGGGEQRQQMSARDVAAGAAAEHLAVEGQVLEAAGVTVGDPGGQHLLQGFSVEAPEEDREGGLARGFAAAEAERVGERGAVVAAELGDGLQGAAAGQQGYDGEPEDGRQGVDAALGVAGIGDGGETFQQGQRGHRRFR